MRVIPIDEFGKPVNVTDVVDSLTRPYVPGAINAQRQLVVDGKGQPIVQIGSLQQLRASSVLTTSYVASTAIDVSQANQLVVFIKFTLGSLTDALVKVEQSDSSDANQQWWPLTIKNTGTVVNDEYQSQLLADVTKLVPTSSPQPYVLYVPIKGRYARVSVKGEGTVTGSLMEIWAYAGVA